MSDVLLASAGEDIRLWNASELSLHSVKNSGTDSKVKFCTCSNDGQLIAYTYEGQGIDISTFEETAPSLKIPTACEQSNVAFSPNSKYLASGGEDCVVNIWNVQSRTAKRSFRDNVNPISYCAFNKDGSVVASASFKGEIILTEVNSGLSSDPLTTQDKQAINCVGYSHFTRNILASVDNGGALSLWDTKEKKLSKTFKEHNSPATCLSFSPINEMLLCSVGFDKRIIFYDVHAKKSVKTMHAGGPITCCDFMDDGTTVAAGSVSGYIFLYDLRHGSTPLKVVQAHRTSVKSISFQKVRKRQSRNLTEEKRVKESLPSSKGSNDAREIGYGRKTLEKPGKDYLEPDQESINSDQLNDTVLTEQDFRKIADTKKNLNNSKEYGLEYSSLSAEVSPKFNQMNESFTMNAVKNKEMVYQPDDSTYNQSSPSARKLSHDDFFSPLPMSPGVAARKPVKRVKSNAKNITKSSTSLVADEGTPRPEYRRSKSGLSRFLLRNNYKSAEDLSTMKGHREKSSPDLMRTKKKNVDDISKRDLADSDKEPAAARKGVSSGFKSPFRKKAHDKRSDDSETSSLDSFGIEDKITYDQSRTKYNLNENKAYEINENMPERLSQTIPQIDTMDIQPSASSLCRSSSVISGTTISTDHGSTRMTNGTGASQVSQIPLEFIQSTIENTVEDYMDSIRSDIVNLHGEFIRQMEIQKHEISALIQQHPSTTELNSEIRALRAELALLRFKN